MDVAEELDRLGGVADVASLRASGVSPDRLERAARTGRIRRVRPGVYASNSAHPEVVRSARVGGRVTGASAAQHWGLWVPPRHPLVVEVARDASHLRHPDNSALPLELGQADVRVLWTAPAGRLSPGFAPLFDVLRACVLTLPAGHAIAVLDSALRAHPIDAVSMAKLQRSLPVSLRWVCDATDARSESGSESILRTALRCDGFDVTIQVPVPFSPLDRIDLVVGDRVAIECDSEEHHGRPGQRRRDLRRDTDLTALGFVVLRFDYAQVLYDIETVLAAVRAAADGARGRSARGS